MQSTTNYSEIVKSSVWIFVVLGHIDLGMDGSICDGAQSANTKCRAVTPESRVYVTCSVSSSVLAKLLCKWNIINISYFHLKVIRYFTILLPVWSNVCGDSHSSGSL